jgi:hypothetical protein
MKKKLILLLLLAAAACRKEAPMPALPERAVGFPLAEARAWYTGRFPNDTLGLNWAQMAQLPEARGHYWLAPLTGQPGSDKTGRGYRKLAIFKAPGGAISARILEFLPDGLYYQRNGKTSTEDFTGRVFIYDEGYHLLGGRILAEGKRVGLIGKRRGIGPLLMNKAPEITETCNWYDNNYINTAGEVVVYSEKICTYSQSGDPLSSGGPGSDLGGGDYAGSPGGSSGAPAPANLPGENNPAIDPKRFMDCFGSLPDAGAKMKVTVYVQEPRTAGGTPPAGCAGNCRPWTAAGSPGSPARATRAAAPRPARKAAGPKVAAASAAAAANKHSAGSRRDRCAPGG